MIFIRPFRHEDWEYLPGLANQAASFAAQENQEWLEKRKAFDESKFIRRHYIAVQSDVPVGYGCLEQQSDDPKWLRIFVVCHPDHLRDEVGTYLYNQLLRDARELGAEHLWAREYQADEPIGKFLTGRGFMKTRRYTQPNQLPMVVYLLDLPNPILIKPFQWQDWLGLMLLRHYQLAEEGITGDDPIQEKPDLNSPYEYEYNRIEHFYLTPRGNFWIAWIDSVPVGHVAAKDKGDFAELYHMYVRCEYRRRGIGTMLVSALIKHCREHQFEAIELWTAQRGLGRSLYEQFSFRQVEAPGEEQVTQGDDNPQIRMRVELKADEQV